MIVLYPSYSGCCLTKYVVLSLWFFSLKEEFPVWYEKLVLEMVHHNTISLEKLVDTSWLEIMTKFAVGEECDFEVRPPIGWICRAAFISLRDESRVCSSV